MFLQLGMIFDRNFHHHSVIIPNLKAGNILISDRCCWSTIAYAKANNIDWRYLIEAHNTILGEHFIKPDLLLFLDVSLPVALERKAKRQTDDLFEREQQMRTNLDVYRELHALGIFPNVVRIDADQNEESVRQQALAAVAKVLLAKVK
jgi:thymidylate kinase